MRAASSIASLAKTVGRVGSMKASVRQKSLHGWWLAPVCAGLSWSGGGECRVQRACERLWVLFTCLNPLQTKQYVTRAATQLITYNNRARAADTQPS